jgi:protein TonB
MPIPAKARIKKEYPHAKIHPSDQTVTRKIPVGEKDQTSGSQKEEETPIPLPIGDLSPSDMDSNIKMENNPPAFLSLVRPGELDQDIIPGLAAGGGSGQEGSGNGGSGEGSQTGRGGFGWRGSGKEAGIGQGGTGGGGSGNGGPGGPHPRYAKNPRPAYPQEARERGYQGVVLLKVEVLSNGIVGQLKVIKSSGYAVLDQCAFAAVQKWRFIPARKEMIAIPCWVNIPIKFELQSDPSRPHYLTD